MKNKMFLKKMLISTSFAGSFVPALFFGGFASTNSSINSASQERERD